MITCSFALALAACAPTTGGGAGGGGGSGAAAGRGGAGGTGAGGRGGNTAGTGGSSVAGAAGATGGTTGGTTGGAGSGGGSAVAGAGGSGAAADSAAPPATSDGPQEAPAGEAGTPSAGSDEPSCARMVPVEGQAALGPALTAARPGDCLIAADGAYGALTIMGVKGTAQAPIQLRAANLLKATVTGLRIEQSEHVIVRGFAMSTILFVNSKHARVTRCQVRGPGSGYWVRVEEQKGCMSGCNNSPPGRSDHARVDHCDIGGGSTSADVFNPTAFSTNTRIDHNYIHDTSGDHLMTLGCCGPTYDYFESGTIVEHNLFVNANGTSAEMISIKGAGVHFRYNTIRAHRGDIDIRAGKNNHIYGNYILGPGPGLRMYEDGHRIYNNYVVGGLVGNRSGPIHAPVRNATVVHNTFTGSVALAGGANNVSANNIILGGGGGGMGNLGGPAAALGLEQKDGLWVLTAGSRAVGAAVGSYPFVMDDIQGLPRGAKADVGAQQFSTAAPLRRPLTTADVGPMAP